MDDLLHIINGKVIVILAVLISCVWGWQKGKSGTAGRSLVPMPSFGGGPGERKHPTDGNFRDRGTDGEGVSIESTDEPAVPAKAAVPGGLPAGRPFAAAASQAAAIPAPAAVPAPAAGETGIGLIPDNEDMARAVLWSEVLGPPQSQTAIPAPLRPRKPQGNLRFAKADRRFLFPVHAALYPEKLRQRFSHIWGRHRIVCKDTRNLHDRPGAVRA